MPFNPDTSTDPEETYPTADARLDSYHQFLTNVLGDLVKRAKDHDVKVNIAEIMELVVERTDHTVDWAVRELRGTYQDTTALPEFWERTLDDAAKELAA